ncbi:hypothetical protein [Nonomuraea sp. NPDC049309]|uniref:hypothetical protein n=1 Tax=Nonomuraea sp. NPDC049309 TaxID=3364350 RepID=UPI00372035DD
MSDSSDNEPVRYLVPDDAAAVAVVKAIHLGDLDKLRHLLVAHPGLRGRGWGTRAVCHVRCCTW